MQPGQKKINELTIGELKGELTRRKLGTMGTKSELYLILEQYIQKTEGENPQTYVFSTLEQGPPHPPTAWTEATRTPGTNQKENLHNNKEQQKNQGKGENPSLVGENPTTATNSLERTLTEILNRLKQLETASASEPILGAVENLTERIKKLEKPKNGKHPESFQESGNDETQRNPPGQEQNREKKTITYQHDVIEPRNNNYDTYYESQVFPESYNRGIPNVHSTPFPVPGTSTMVTTSITNVITSTSCTHTNTRGKNPQTIRHREYQYQQIGLRQQWKWNFQTDWLSRC